MVNYQFFYKNDEKESLSIIEKETGKSAVFNLK